MSEVALNNVVKSFGPVHVIKGIDLEVKSGEFVVFVGPVRLRQVDAAAHGRRARDHHQRRRSRSAALSSTTCRRAQRDIAMVFQDYALYPHKTVFENMAFGLRLRKHARSTRSDAGSATRRSILQIHAPARAQAARALRRAAPARGDGPRHRAPAQGLPVRRAAVATSTRSCAPRCASRSRSCTSASARRSSTSRTTRSRR